MSSSGGSAVADVEVEDVVQTKSAPRTQDPKRKPKRQPPYNVILLDDDHHSYAYVIAMLGRLFGYSTEKAYLLACELDNTGRVILMTTTKELGELKQEQIHAFGPDPLIHYCQGSMSAVLEPSPV